jgi:RimJ/RimL family protein N-acetyltransferase
MVTMQTQFTPLPNLTTERLLLRPLKRSDAPEIFIQRSDERIIRYTEIPKAMVLEDAVNWIDKLADITEKGEGVAWVICRKGEEKLIGTICLYHLDAEKATAELGYSLHPDFWRMGYASEALAAVMDFGFNVMKAHFLEAYSNNQNLASLRLLEKAGFAKIGEVEQYHVFASCQAPFGRLLLETERLSLREATKEDAQFLYDLVNSPDWLKNIGDRGVHNLDDARKYAINRVLLNCRKDGFGFYVMIRKSDGAPLGMCGLVKRDFLDDIDIGYALLPEFYGKGYAHEAAHAMMLFAEQQLNLPRIAAITTTTNLPSIRLLDKLGLRHEKNFFAPDDKEELMLFGMELGQAKLV